MAQLAKQVQALCIKKGWTLSVAESCTGGRLAARLTQVPGASAYFLGGVVSYSNSLKMGMLGVSQNTLETYGAVSAEVAQEMVLGVVHLSGSDVGIATTGIAGPGGGRVDKPVGTVWCAIVIPEREVHVWKIQAGDERIQVMDASVDAVLEEFLKFNCSI